MNQLLASSYLALPEFILLFTATLGLLCDLFFKKPYLTFSIILLGLLAAGVSSFLFIGEQPQLIFNNLYLSDDISHLAGVFICASVFLCFYYSVDYIRAREMPDADYYVLGTFSTLGMLVLISAQSLLTIYLGLELLSLPLYAMVAIKRNDGDGSEASMKYFVMGALASAMILYGMSMIYGATGELELAKIALKIQSLNDTNFLILGMIFILAGFGFKLTQVPFHMWAPDVYQGAPLSVTLFVSTAPKIAALVMTLRVLIISFPELNVQWQQIVLVMALLSVFVGNLVAIAQKNIKRMFAYSTISHMGYALFGIAALSTSGYAYSLYYIIIYALMSAGAFGLLVLLSRQNIEVENIDDLKGLNKLHPWLAFMMLIVLFSMAGVPPTVGFFIKLLVLKALVDANLLWVAVIGVIFAVIGAFYYIRIVKVMYFDDVESLKPVTISKPMTLIFSANCLLLLYFGIFPSALISACLNAFS